ncbi:MAG: GNAT family N-acetyltransferase [Pseudomonadota bacterium]|nr:GNAT family N-acetyltransferase [Pseudomonadota bacterium]
MNVQTLEVRIFAGEVIAAHLDDIARLRMAVLREWPHLYGGDMGDEFGYLQRYLRSPHSIAVLVYDDDKAVGAATGMPMADESAGLLAGFEHSSVDPGEVFHFGESVLLPRYRGRGLGHRFFEERERHAHALGGFSYTGFGVVERADDDSRRPPFQRSNEAFWRKRGYAPRAGLQLMRPWQEIGAGEVQHTLDVWLRPLERVF